MRSPDWLRRRAGLTPERPALLFGDQVWTWAELDRRVDRLAGALADLGAGRESRVGALLRNGPRYVELVHALMRLGSTIMPLNTRLTAAEIAWQVEDVRAGLLIHDEHYEGVARSLQVSGLRTVPLESVGRRKPEGTDDEPPAGLSSVHAIMYTSGTTGRPKGAMLTYGNHWWSALASARNLGMREEDRWLLCLPMFHIGGLTILLRGVLYGMPVVLHPSFDEREVNRAIDGGVTIVSLVPTMLQRVLDIRRQTPLPSTLRCVLLGGGPAGPSLLEACRERGVPVVQTYGLTETASQVATLAPADALRKLGSAGKALSGTEIRIEREGLPLPAWEVGEIVVRGPTVMAGYFGRPDATQRALRDGWLHTGDLGYVDSEGYLYVVDRRDDLIITGGENVYPSEVEAVLLAHPAVEMALVVGIPDETWGQTVAAAVKLKEGAAAGASELLALCRERLAGYKVPRRLRFVDDLPRTASGKLLRWRVRDLV
ncbi:MAG: o-succinylbenzoate--CoA ligase [Chloroflexi bacterium]|nr:o-succinylbenzoate--CoA ligase [Chloroflexota bacterium]